MALANTCIPLFEPGGRVTGTATAPIIGKRFVSIAGARQTDSTLSFVQSAAAARSFGVAEYDQPNVGGFVGVLSGSNFILPVTSGGAIAAGADVEIDATGRAVTRAAGVAVAMCLDTVAAAGADALVRLL